MPRVQRGANALFRITADRLVFTTDYEARVFGASASDPVVPIGSNLPIHPGTPARDDTVLYFGQIRARKGLEAFIALARLADAAGEPGRYLVIGSTPPRWLDYARALRSQAPASVCWLENMPAAAIAEAMATASASFLPFPDGAGFRRGSLLAALANGLPVIAPLGASTSDELRAVLFEADTPEQALAQIQLIRAAPNMAAQRATAGRRLVERFSWDAIAAQHIALYRSLFACETQSEAYWPQPNQ
jgi:glycosyltransferase involved in cell wall biosynthesis